MSSDEIAIVGIGCRFPGSDNIDEFWETLVNGENHIVDIPSDRWDVSSYYDPNGGEGKYYSNKAGLLKGGSAWENRFFGINETESSHIDPQQKLTLECVHMALENAGLTSEDISGTDTGVYVGLMNNDFGLVLHSSATKIHNFTVSGLSGCIAANRISYFYNLSGPSMTLDTACSSSFIALHTACQGIRVGDCSMAIVGGVNRILTPQQLVMLSKANMLSKTGQCYAFSESTDGYVRGEGCGVVILKPLRKAIDDRNEIWGTIKGCGSNQDGRMVTPMTKPSSEQQMKLILKVVEQAKLNPNNVDYIEAHGTGTHIGDKTEAHSLKNTYGKMRSSDVEACFIGSVKTNIGHLESAAGMAGLLKVLLMMKYGKIVPSLHYEENPRRDINFQEANLKVATKVVDWPVSAGSSRTAALNCFGFGGTNVHVIIEKRSNYNDHDNEIHKCATPLITTISGAQVDSLKETIKYFLDEMERKVYSLPNIAFESTVRRNHYRYRVSVVSATTEELLSKLKGSLSNLPTKPCLLPKDFQVVFVFSGMGTAWNGMCLGLMKTNASFADKMHEISALFQKLSGFSLIDELPKISDRSSPNILQPLLFAFQVSLCEVWKTLGIVPHCVIGHSVGEIAAACVAGGLEIPDGVRIIYHRSRLLSKLSSGKMLAVGGMSVTKIEELCVPFNGRVNIAAFNSPTSCTLSGDDDAIDEIHKSLDMLNTQGGNIFVRPLRVSTAYHSHHTYAIADELCNSLKDLKPVNADSVSLASTVLGRRIKMGELQYPTHWSQNVCQPVLFQSALESLISSEKMNIFIEMGFKPALRENIKEISTFHKSMYLPSVLQKSEWPTMMKTLSELYKIGLTPKWGPIFGHFIPSHINIPRYQFTRVITEKDLSYKEKARANETVVSSTSRHPFMKCISSEPTVFKARFDKVGTPFVSDHIVQGYVLVPGATHVEIALHCVLETHSPRELARNCSVDFELSNALFMNHNCEVAISVKRHHVDTYNVEVMKDSTVISRSAVRISRNNKIVGEVDLRQTMKRMKKHITGKSAYEGLKRFGFEYGPSMRGIQEAWFSDDESLTRLELGNAVLSQQNEMTIHPGVLDLFFQSLITIGVNENADLTSVGYIPKYAEGVVVRDVPQTKMYCYIQVIDKNNSYLHFSGALMDEHGRVIVECKKMIGCNPLVTPPENWLYTVDWVKGNALMSVNSSQQKSQKYVVFGNDSQISKAIVSRLHHDSVLITKDTAIGKLFSKVENVNSDESQIMNEILQQCSCVLYLWGCYEVNEFASSNELGRKVHFACNGLRNIYTLLQSQEIHISCVIVTHKTQSFMEDMLTNVCGSELWGMARSLQKEVSSANAALVLVDLATGSSQEIENLHNIAQSPMSVLSTEIALNGSEIYLNKICQVNFMSEIHQYRLNKTDNSMAVMFSSSKPQQFENVACLNGVNGMRTRENGINITVNISSFRCHEPFLYPVSKREIDVEPLECGSPNVIMTLDMKGRIKNQNRRKDDRNVLDVVICCPAVLQHEVVVPRWCVLPLESIPQQCQSLLSVYVFAWFILNVKVQIAPLQRLLILHDTETTLLCTVLSNVALLYTTHISASNFEVICDLELSAGQSSDLKRYDIIISLGRKDIRRLDLKNTDAKIVNITGWNMEDKRRSEVDNLFEPNYLKCTLPKVIEWLRVLSRRKLLPAIEESELRYTNGLSIPTTQDRVKWVKLKHIDSAPVDVKCNRPDLFRRDALYVVVGGLTGLGKEVVKFLALRGAGYVACMSRRKPNEEDMGHMSDIANANNIRIISIRADVTIYQTVEESVNKLRESYPGIPIKGVFFGAMVLADGLVQNQTYENFKTAIDPKVKGCWNLHLVTAKDSLDYFLMHSSITSVIGNASQTNYGAGNAFMDTLAFYRRERGLAAQSVNWGPLLLGALDGREDLIRTYSRLGSSPMSIEDVHTTLETILLMNKPQVMAWNVNWNKYVGIGVHMLDEELDHQSMYRVRALVTNPLLMRNDGETTALQSFSKFTETDKKLPKHERGQSIETILKKMLVQILVVDQFDLSADDILIDVGLDSALAVEARNLVQKIFDYEVLIMTLLSETTTIKYLSQSINDHFSEEEAVSYDSKL